MPPKTRPVTKKPRKHLQRDLWHGKIMKTKSGKTRRDVLRIPVPGGGYRYVWKSRHEHGKKMYQKSKSTLTKYQFK